MRRKEVLLAVIIVVSIIGISAIIWSKINEPKHIEVTARIVKKDMLLRLDGPGSLVFLMDNGDLVEVPSAEYYEYEIGDTYTYCTSQVLRL